MLIPGAAILLTLMASPIRREIQYGTTTQTPLLLTVYAPRWQVKPHAGVLFLHGGGWWTGKRTQFDAHARALAKHGYLAATADYRVYGRHGTLPDLALEDATAAFRWLQQELEVRGVAADRIVLVGGSAGGHLALCIAANCGAHKQPPNPMGLLLLNPVLDLHQVSPETGFSEGELMLIERLGVAGRKRLSPLDPGAARQVAGRAWLVYGSADPLLGVAKHLLAHHPLGESWRLLEAPGQTHGFFNRQPWRGRTRRLLLDFLRSLDLPTTERVASKRGDKTMIWPARSFQEVGAASSAEPPADQPQ